MKGARGERNGRAKLSELQVRRVFDWLGEGWTHQRIANRLGVARSTVSDITRGRRWTHVVLA